MDCRVLPHEIGDGPANMALDEALLDAVDASPASAVFRTYAWSEPTLSLGYFQGESDIAADPRWRDLPTVRRPSGGGALWHHHEITYALVVPRTHPLAGRPSHLYRAVHAGIAELLRERGVDASRRGDVAPATLAGRPFLCVLDRDSEDIMLRDRKIVGSAQRRRPSAVLQHGSLLLEASSRTPELPGLHNLGSQTEGAATWARHLGARLPEILGLAPHDDVVTHDERSHAFVLATQRYRDDAWTFRRRRATPA